MVADQPEVLRAAVVDLQLADREVRVQDRAVDLNLGAGGHRDDCRLLVDDDQLLLLVVPDAR
ncbi:MAG: hypothetical protein P8Y37_00780, partial [Anaerolineales bacterium]